MENLKPYADNVILLIEPEVTKIGLIHVVPKRNVRGSRVARVLASGPGFYKDPSYGNPQGVFVPNEVKAGDRVIVDALAGQNYQLDISVPRHNKDADFQDLLGAKGEFRIVREQEILGIIDEDVVDVDTFEGAQCQI